MRRAWGRGEGADDEGFGAAGLGFGDDFDAEFFEDFADDVVVLAGGDDRGGGEGLVGPCAEQEARRQADFPVKRSHNFAGMGVRLGEVGAGEVEEAEGVADLGRVLSGRCGRTRERAAEFGARGRCRRRARAAA